MNGFTLVDGIVLVVVVLSAILAYSRGFLREMLAIAGWVIAAICGFFFAPAVEPLVREIPVLKDIIGTTCELSMLAAFAAVFAVALVIVSIFTPLLSGAVQNSALGPVDQGLGFLFGGAEGGAARRGGREAVARGAGARAAEGAGGGGGGASAVLVAGSGGTAVFLACVSVGISSKRSACISLSSSSSLAMLGCCRFGLVTAVNAEERSVAEEKRSSRSLAIALLIISLQAGGKSGRTLKICGTGSITCFIIMRAGVSASNGVLPVSIWKRITPSA